MSLAKVVYLLLALFLTANIYTTMASVLKHIVSKTGPQPVGPYSSAVEVNNNLYLSGIIGIDKDSGKLVPGGIVAETEKIFEHLKNILDECGSSVCRVASVKVYLDDINNGAKVNEIYQKYFKPPYPARAMMEVGKLPMNAKIELEALAVKNSSKL